jgi:hypothetical protein
MIGQHTGIDINPVGIADILQQRSLSVPLNQRPYKWEDGQVQKLFEDLNKAFDDQPLYFLGTVMFTLGSQGRIEVADGQQRLATISILIAAMRDYLIELGDEDGAKQYQADFLIKYDPPSGSYKPRLTLNHQDHDFFYNYILLPPDKRPDMAAGTLSSHERIADAAKLAREHVLSITSSLATSDKLKRVYDWLEYLRQTALVIAVSVPASVGSSFKMFETLNARGVPATQVDILKNYLFDKASNHTSSINSNWHSMITTIEAHGDDYLVLAFIRHAWVSLHGPTTIDELGSQVEKTIINEQRALSLASTLESAASDYVALLTPLQSPRWEGLSSNARKALDIISNEFGGEQIRPLMLAVARRFDPAELEKAFKMFLSWSVRFLIVGGGGGGKLDRYYGLRAKQVSNGEIKDAAQLSASMADVVPSDAVFQEEFSRASVKKANLARYYLRAIHVFRSQDENAAFLLNEDANAVNLEHVLPIHPSEDWKIDPDVASSVYKRLGNMVLLPSKVNVALGNGGFDAKKETYADIQIEVTKDVPAYDAWGPEQIADRQKKLAQEAPKVWPLSWK